MWIKRGTKTDSGFVLNPVANARLSYAELSKEMAAKLPVPTNMSP